MNKYMKNIDAVRKRKSNNLRDKKGVTLIALVITIIVLLMLAGISINMILGQDGILNKATIAKEENKNKSNEEQVKLAVMESIDETGINYAELKENLNNISNINEIDETIDENSFPLTVQMENNYIKITKDGKVSSTKISNNEYVEVEYIESTGTQFIDTGFIPTKKTSIEVDAQVTTVSSSYQFLFGTRNDSIENKSWFELIKLDPTGTLKGANYWCFHYGETNIVNQVEEDTERHIFKLDAIERKGYIDNILINENTEIEDEEDIKYSLVLFASRYGISNTGTYCISAKMFSVKLWDNNVLVRDMVPCYRKSDNVAGMYDVVNDVFYPSIGSKNFIAGNEI